MSIESKTGSRLKSHEQSTRPFRTHLLEDVAQRLLPLSALLLGDVVPLQAGIRFVMKPRLADRAGGTAALPPRLRPSKIDPHTHLPAN